MTTCDALRGLTQSNKFVWLEFSNGSMLDVQTLSLSGTLMLAVDVIVKDNVDETTGYSTERSENLSLMVALNRVNLKDRVQKESDSKYKANEESEVIDLRDDEISGGWDRRSRTTYTLSWAAEDYRLALTGFRCGGVTAWRPSQRDPERDYRMRPYFTYNLTANYNWSDSFSTGLRVRNLFDAKPPKDETFLFYDYPWYNHFVYAGAGIGRELYVEANYTF